MVIPVELALLLDRLSRDEQNCVDIYVQALRFVEKNPNLLSYVMGHRRLVSAASCPKVDSLLLHVARNNPKCIPADYRARLPEQTALVAEIKKLFARHNQPVKFRQAAE